MSTCTVRGHMSCQGVCTKVVAPALKSHQVINVLGWTRSYEQEATLPRTDSRSKAVLSKGRLRVFSSRSTTPAVVITETMAAGGGSFWRGSGGTSVQAGAPKCCSVQFPRQMPSTNGERPPWLARGCNCGKSLALR